MTPQITNKQMKAAYSGCYQRDEYYWKAMNERNTARGDRAALLSEVAEDLVTWIKADGPLFERVVCSGYAHLLGADYIKNLLNDLTRANLITRGIHLDPTSARLRGEPMYWCLGERGTGKK